MNNLRKFFVAITLTVVLAGTTLAECPLPGESSTPPLPCTATQALPDDSVNQSTTAPTVTDEVEAIVFDVFLTGFESLLTIY